MRGFLAKLCKKNGIAKRIFSMALAVMMLTSTVQALPAGILTAHAAESYDVTVHWLNTANFAADSVHAHMWTGNFGTEWPGVAVAENTDNEGWFTATKTGLTDANFGIIFNNGNGGSGNQTANIEKVLSAGANEFWVTGTLEAPVVSTTAPEGWVEGSGEPTPPAPTVTYDVTVHWLNTVNFAADSVHAHVWTGNFGTEWPGVAVAENANNEGWFTINASLTDANFGIIFNNGNGGSGNQTANIEKVLSAGANEFWVTGTLEAPVVSTTAPEGWVVTYDVTVHWLNTVNFAADSVHAHMWTGNFGTEWPGVAVAENADNEGWFTATKTGLTDANFGIIFNNGNGGSGNQTANIEKVLSAGANEFWVTGTLEAPVVSTTAPEGWVEGSGEPTPPAPTVTYDVTVHVPKTFGGWEKVNVYAYAGAEVAGSWPGTELTTVNAQNDTYYDISFEDLTNEDLLVILNTNNGTVQTADLTATLTEDTTDLWITGDAGAAVMTATAPEGWVPAAKTLKINYYNAEAAWENVAVWVWDSNNVNYTGGNWPGQAASKTSDNADDYWWSADVTGIEVDAVNIIVNNNNNGAQTTDLAVTMTDAAVTEVWVVGNTVFTTEPTQDEIEDVFAKEYIVKIHYFNRSDMDTITAYTWSSFVGSNKYSAWPGSSEGITANAEHEGWYDFTITKKDTSDTFLIFNNNGNGKQTADLKINVTGDVTEVWVDGYLGSESVYYEEVASWNDPEAEPGIAPNSNLEVTDFFEVEVNGTKYPMDVYVNGWFETIVPMEAIDYTVNFYLNGEILDEWSDLSLPLDEAGDMVFYGYDDGSGLWFNAGYVDDLDVLRLVGSLNDLSDEFPNWDPAADTMKLTYLGGNLYGITIEFPALEEETVIEYKVTENGVWDGAYGNEEGGNITATIPAGSTSFTVYVDWMLEEVYDNINNAFTISGAKNDGLTTVVSLIGYVRGFGNTDDDWNASMTGWEFTPISDTLYRFDYTVPTANTALDYKVVFDYSGWLDGGNRPLATYEDNTRIIFLYDTVSGNVYDTVNNNEKVAELLSMKPTTVKSTVLDNGDGTLTFITGAPADSEVVLYWADKADAEADVVTAFTAVDMGEVQAKKATATVSFGDPACEIVYFYTVDGEVKLDENAETVTIDGTEFSYYMKEAFGGRVVNLPGSFPGPSWDTASNKMTYLGDGIYSLTFRNLAAATYEYKVAINGSWNENYGANGALDGGNIQLTVPSLMDVTIYYSDVSHLTATSIDYVFADIDLVGTGVPEGTKLTDPGLTSIFSAAVEVEAGTYDDWQIKYDGQTFDLTAFTLDEAKTVNVYMDIATLLYYHDAVDMPLETEAIYFNSKDTEYKSVFGAVATGEEVTFSMTTGTDATAVQLVVKGVENKAVALAKDGEAVNGVQKWSATTSFSVIGENKFYFAITNGATMSVYCDDDGYYGEGKLATLTDVKPYDLVVYKSGFETPDWMKNAVIYQIFPDRFFDGDESNNDAQRTARGAVDYEWITDWYTLPENPEKESGSYAASEAEYKATGAHWGDGQWSNEIYGGDLKGITENIEYLKALGVTVIYLNPVFSSISSHRYDACDYMEIDPVLGTLGDFEEMVAIAEANGMKVVLDGVFNHVSDDSIYFDRYYKFLGDEGNNTVGAYPYWAFVYDYMADYGTTKEAAEAAAKAYFTNNYGVTDYSYTEWFEVYQTPMGSGDVYDTIGWRTDRPVYGYEGWWGYDSMPVIKSTNGSEYQSGNWAEQIIKADDNSSVTQYWISKGMDGWRLDVANEVSDETWQNFRQSVKALDSEAVIIGEIWTDATKYILGDMYDSVMNYMFRTAAVNFVKGTDSNTTMLEMEKLRERYPKEAFYAMMNLVGSHDTTRILSYLDGIDDDRNQKDMASAFPTYAATSENAKQMQYLVAFLQFTYAGAPTIYYGDEIGMVGADDPDDRRAFEWGRGNEALVTYYASLANVRSQYSALRTGSVEAFDTENENVLGYVRRDNANTIVVLANNSASAQSVTIDLTELNVDADVLKDVLDSSASYTVSDGVATINVAARRGAILVDDQAVVTVAVDTEALSPAFDPAYEIEVREDFEEEIVRNEIIAEVPVTPPTQPSTPPSGEDAKEETTTGAASGAGTGASSVTSSATKEVTTEVTTDAPTTVPEDVTDVTPVVSEDLQDDISASVGSILTAIANGDVDSKVMDTATLANVLKAQREGKDIVTEVKAENIDKDSVDGDVSSAAEDALKDFVGDKEGATTDIISFIDMGVLLKTDDGTELGSVNKLDKAVTLTVAVPQDLVKAGKVYAVLCRADGTTKLIETVMNDDSTVSFETDEIGTFALACVDIPDEESPTTSGPVDTETDVDVEDTDTEKEAKSIAPFVFVGIGVVALAAFVIILLALKRKKEE